jgi:putative spermidine/putrescine transport system permease protein
LKARDTSAVLALYTALVCVFAIAPVVIILIESLTAANYVAFPPSGLSLRWYLEIPRRPEFVASLTTSLVVATVAGAGATVLGTLAALALVRYRFAGRDALQGLFLSPLSLPAIVLGIALLQFYSTMAIPRNTATLVLAHILFTCPYTLRLVSVSLTSFDANLERAARNLGATSFTAFRRVTMPLICPGMFAGLVFAFIVSFDDISVSLFLASDSAMTLPVRVFTYIEQNSDPFITAVSSLLILIVVVLAVAVERTVGIGKLFGVR